MESEEEPGPDQPGPAERRQGSNSQAHVTQRPMFRFNPARDILLLREVVGQRPYAAGYGQTSRAWDAIVTNLKAIGMDVTLTTVQGRYTHLKKAYRTQQMEQMRRSGTEEEYTEREQLLQDIIELEAAAASEAHEKRQERDAKERNLEEQGASLRSAATFGRQRSQSESDPHDDKASSTVSQPKKRRSTTADDFIKLQTLKFEAEIEDRRQARESDFALRTRELALRQQELDMQR
jgi:flagellar biosynthesis GTPase FlhF